MPTLQAKPIPTLITEDVARSLSRVSVEEGYPLGLIVERLNAENHEFNRPRHLLAIVDPGDPQKQGDNSTAEDEYIRTYVIHVWIIPSQLNEIPIDETIDAVVAACVRALCSDEEDADGRRISTRRGLANDTVAGDPETIGPLPNSLAWLVNVPFDIRYTTRERELLLEG